MFRQLYVALVRPLLEYGIQATSPYLDKDIKLVEGLQRLATRMVKGLRETPYPARLEALRLFSMEHRLLRGDLILTYNLFLGRLDLPLEEFFEAPGNRNLRGHDFKVRPQKPRLQRRQHAYAVRTANPWNKLPKTVVDQPTLSSFKEELDEHLKKQKPPRMLK